MREHDNGRSSGFGFVTFGSGDEANEAISGFVPLVPDASFVAANKDDE